MAYRVVDPALLPAGPGPHPAASLFDKRITEHLGIRAFEVYQVELPPHAETVRHDHKDDKVEDLYAIVQGDGWVLVDDDPVAVHRGEFVAVSVDSARQVRAGDDGMVLIATCAAPR